MDDLMIAFGARMTHRVDFRVHDKMWHQIKALAKRRQTSVSTIGRYAMGYFLQQLEFSGVIPTSDDGRPAEPEVSGRAMDGPCTASVDLTEQTSDLPQT